MTETILYETRGHVGRLTLNNPEKHNSLGRDELDLIHRALERIAVEPDVRVLLVTGTGGKTFCAGASLPELNNGEISGDDYQDMTDSIAALRIPTICAINGNVFGGGVELALSCDFRIGVEGTRMRVPAAAIGLCYPLRGIERFVEKLGGTMAMRILIAAETFSADEMLQAGVLDHLVMPAQFNDTVDDFASRIAGLAPLAVQAMKSVIQSACSGNIDRREAAALAESCSQSADLKEGFAALAEKRSPVFRGA